MSADAPTPDKLVDLHIAHLTIIQGVIARVAGFSAGVKNFCVTITAAVIAVAFQKQNPLLLWASVAVVLIFFAMDTYYLAIEKRYRQLYEKVARRPLTDPPQLSLKAERLNAAICFQAARSLSVAGFYALLLIGVVSLLCVANHVQRDPAPAATLSAGDAVGAPERQSAGVAAGAGADRRESTVRPTGQRAQSAGAPTNDAGEPVRPR